MAVDQLRNLNFFRDMLSTSDNYSNNNNNNNINLINYQIPTGGNNLHSNITNSIPPAAATATINDSLLYPFYNNLNNFVFNSGAGKLPPAVKDDSGVTFNNSFIPPPVLTSRKRPRESTVMVSGAGGIPASLITSYGAGSVVSKESNGFSFLGEDLSLQIMQQQLELDRLVSQHMEKMRMEMDRQRKQQLTRTMAAMAEKMREKDEEISKVMRINWELEDKVKTLYLQSQIWRDVAQTNEATANALRTNVEQVLLHQNDAVRTTGSTDDAVSCCGSGGGEEEEERERGQRWVYRGGCNGKWRCKKCGEGESTVLVLPCRHLCLCTICGPTVNACPICDSVKSASIHVNLS